MQVKGSVKLKKVTVGGAIYALSLPGFQTANLVVPALPGAVCGAVGTVTVTIEEPMAPKEPAKPKKKK